MNSKEIKAHNLPSDRHVIYHMETKPYILLVILLIIGFAMFLVNATIAIIITSTMIYAIILLPSKVIIDFTNDYLIRYNRPSKSDCVMIYYDEIVMWTYKKGSLEDELIIELIDGHIERVECFNRTRVRMIMNEHARDKESRIR